jgi:heat shock protein HslJ
VTGSDLLRRLPLAGAACLLLTIAAPVAAQEPDDPSTAQAVETTASPSMSPSPSAPVTPTLVLQPTGAWRVVTFDPWGEGLVEPLPDSTLTVVLLQDGGLEGETGCGRYRGGYALDGPALAFGTVTLGHEPCDQRHTEESVALSSALDTVASWRAVPGGLELSDVDGMTRLVLAPVSPGGPAGRWVVEWYRRPNGRPVEAPDGAPMSLTLEPGGVVSGSTGCRFFGGSWTSDGDVIAIGPLETTGLPCAGEAQRRERQLLRALSAATRWQRDGETFLLIDAFDMPSVELHASSPEGDGA